MAVASLAADTELPMLLPLTQPLIETLARSKLQISRQHGRDISLRAAGQEDRRSPGSRAVFSNFNRQSPPKP